MLSLMLTLLSAPGPQVTCPPSGHLQIAGTVVYDTSQGPITCRDITIQPNGVLRVQGTQPLRIVAHGTLDIQGVIDLGGSDAQPVFSPLIPPQDLVGAIGGPGGGQGGDASPVDDGVSPFGQAGDGPSGWQEAGGRGGETAWRRHAWGGGGGGGAFGPPATELSPGARAQPGGDGAGKGVVFGGLPRGGRSNPTPFRDGDPTNDFWGRRPTATGVVLGELPHPRAGAGGGAGGDDLTGLASFLLPPWFHTEGGPGGGGGGLALLRARSIRLGPGGRILARGGDGANGFVTGPAACTPAAAAAPGA